MRLLAARESFRASHGRLTLPRRLWCSCKGEVQAKPEPSKPGPHAASTGAAAPPPGAPGHIPKKSKQLLHLSIFLRNESISRFAEMCVQRVGKRKTRKGLGISIERREGIGISQLSVSSGNGGSRAMTHTSPWPTCESQFELALLLGWNCGVPAQCWDGPTRIWVFSYCEEIEKALEAET